MAKSWKNKETEKAYQELGESEQLYCFRNVGNMPGWKLPRPYSQKIIIEDVADTVEDYIREKLGRAGTDREWLSRVDWEQVAEQMCGHLGRLLAAQYSLIEEPVTAQA